MSVGDPRDLERARSLLGVDMATDAAGIRSAYRRLVRRHHPDLTGAADDGSVVADLTDAYRLLASEPVVPGDERAGGDDDSHLAVRLAGDDALWLGVPADEAFVCLVEAVGDVGEVTALDEETGLIDASITFEDGRRASLLVTLQGRSAGGTEAFCTLEPLDAGPAPAVGPLCGLLVRRLTELGPFGG